VADSPVARARLPDRLLRVTGQDPPEIAASKARSMRRLVLLTLACEAWDALRFVPYSSRPAAFGVVAAAMTGLAVVGWGGRFAHLALVVAGVLLLGVVVFVFPENANHQFLALVGANTRTLRRSPRCAGSRGSASSGRVSGRSPTATGSAPSSYPGGSRPIPPSPRR
jgi:hypothetical protein